MVQCDRTQPNGLAKVGTIEVRVYRHGHFIHGSLYESEKAAVQAVRAWEAIDGVVCEVDDITDHYRHGHAIAA
jgi:hypothetical protein